MCWSEKPFPSGVATGVQRALYRAYCQIAFRLPTSKERRPGRRLGLGGRAQGVRWTKDGSAGGGTEQPFAPCFARLVTNHTSFLRVLYMPVM